MFNQLLSAHFVKKLKFPTAVGSGLTMNKNIQILLQYPMESALIVPENTTLPLTGIENLPLTEFLPPSSTPAKNYLNTRLHSKQASTLLLFFCLRQSISK